MWQSMACRQHIISISCSMDSGVPVLLRLPLLGRSSSSPVETLGTLKVDLGQALGDPDRARHKNSNAAKYTRDIMMHAFDHWDRSGRVTPSTLVYSPVIKPAGVPHNTHRVAPPTQRGHIHTYIPQLDLFMDRTASGAAPDSQFVHSMPETPHQENVGSIVVRLEWQGKDPMPSLTNIQPLPQTVLLLFDMCGMH